MGRVEDLFPFQSKYLYQNNTEMVGINLDAFALGVNLLGREKSHKRGVKNKQFLAAMDNEYLTKVLAAA